MPLSPSHSHAETRASHIRRVVLHNNISNQARSIASRIRRHLDGAEHKQTRGAHRANYDVIAHVLKGVGIVVSEDRLVGRCKRRAVSNNTLKVHGVLDDITAGTELSNGARVGSEPGIEIGLDKEVAIGGAVGFNGLDDEVARRADLGISAADRHGILSC